MPAHADNVVFCNNAQTCPRCGGAGLIANVSGSQGPDGLLMQPLDNFSRETIGRYQELLSRIAEEDLSLEEIKEAVKEVAPDVAAKIEARGQDLPRNWWITVLLLLVSSCAFSGSVNFNDLLDQAWHLYQGQDPGFHQLPDETQARELGHPLSDDDGDREGKGGKDAKDKPAG